MQEPQETYSLSKYNEKHWQHSRTVSAVVWVIWSIFLFAAVIGFVAHEYVNEHSFRIKFFTDCLFSFAALAIVITQAVIYSQQRDAMKQQVNIARVAERAYIHIEDMRLVAPLGTGPLPNVRIVFRNAGRTPAHSFISYTKPCFHSGTIEEAMQDFPLTLYPPVAAP